MKRIGLTCLLLFFSMLTTLTACEPAPASVPFGYEVGPIDWRGDYEFYEAVGDDAPSQIWVYSMQVRGNAPEYDVKLSIHGFQTALEANCTGRVDIEDEDRRLTVVLKSYGEFKGPYKAGAALFALEREFPESPPRTFWLELQPNLERNRKPGGRYFERAPNDS